MKLNLTVEKLAIITAVYAVMSIITFISYWIDKRASTRGSWRTPERNLHTLELVCGWPGAYAAMWLLRHKNRKGSFILLTILCTLANITGLALLLWRF
ncbi:MAG TPA: DUF1294 domain-containing protein [Phycisphaerales bacterium]|nr:DUF1294 domain-containing protein [Phycisphaerales bacterium]